MASQHDITDVAIFTVSEEHEAVFKTCDENIPKEQKLKGHVGICHCSNG